jgi:UPF0755 protein
MKLKLVALITLLVLLSGLGAYYTVQTQVSVQPPEARTLVITPGTSTQGIARKLEAAGVIRSAFMFRLLARLRGDAQELQSGEYSFSEPAKLSQVMQRLRHGDVVLHRLTVAEGLRNDEILVLLASQTQTPLALWQEAFEKMLEQRKIEGEGFLLPETYTYRLPVDAHAVLLDMFKAQQALMKTLLPTWKDAQGLRIVASIVEKETAVDAERPLVAAVIRNRLERRMALQMDPTVIYGLWHEDGNFSGNLRKGDLRRDTPWNSYTRKGLPPTPICNPGAASLRAAADPADVEYLYFVADGSGGHAFASTLEEHNANVRHWMKFERNR